MDNESIKKRVNDLIVLAGNVLTTEAKNIMGYYVSSELFNEFRSSSLSFLNKIFSEDHIFYKEFYKNVNTAEPSIVKIGRGILNSAKEEIYDGWLFTFKSLVSAEIFSDFLEMADYLLKENYKDPSAVMIGSVLEEHLRNLCKKNNIEIVNIKDGKSSPKKADSLNSELASAKIYNLLDQKSITSWLDLRNKAAHGKYSEYSKEQVEIMFQGVMNFISRTS